MNKSLEHQTATRSHEPIVPWHPAARFGFRALLCYLVLFNLPFPLHWIPYGGLLLRWPWGLWRRFVVWAGAQVLHLSHPITVFSNGSWDTTYDYTSTLCKLAIAIAAAVAWSVLDRRRSQYRTLHQWFRIYLRFALAQWMISYGAVKIFRLQFSDPRISDLLTTYGESTPMHLLWIFMGASKTYSLFAGSVEMLGGILLIVPRLALLGSLLSAAAMANVFALNLSYDVPVKLFSFHLLLMAVVLTAPDLHRLAAMFLFNRPAPAADHVSLFRKRRFTWGLLGAQVAFGLVMIGSNVSADYRNHRDRIAAARPVTEGVWAVDEFEAAGVAVQPSSPTHDAWQQVIFDGRREAVLRFNNGWRQRYLQRPSPGDGDGNVVLWSREDLGLEGRRPRSVLSVVLTDPDSMTLDGRFEGRQVHVRLHRVPVQDFLLTTRKFHWINEYPFNRFDEH